MILYSVTVGAVQVIPDVSGIATASFSKGAINTPKPPPLEATDSADKHTRFLALQTLSNPLLLRDSSQLPNPFVG